MEKERYGMLFSMKYDYIIEALMDRLEKEWINLYWNKYHIYSDNTPWKNTGMVFKNDVFTVRAYYWGDDDEKEQLPNFQYKGLAIKWYKHSNRGLNWKCDECPLTLDFLNNMMRECITSMKRSFDNDEV